MAPGTARASFVHNAALEDLLLDRNLTGVGFHRACFSHRAALRGATATDADLCSRCGRGRAAIDTGGRLMPCVLGRHHTAGDVCKVPLAELLERPEWSEMVGAIHGHGSCAPEDSNDCNPAG